MLASSQRLGSGRMFDRIAPRYDLLNRVLSFGLDGGWRRRCARALRLPPAARVLDLATGTGDLAREILRQYPDAHVVALDPAPRMLEVARRKLGAELARGRLALGEGGAADIPFPDGSFDAVTIAFGIRNVPDIGAALGEMKRVTRAGGHVAVLELLEPAEGPAAGGGIVRIAARVARFHVRHVVPAIGAALSGREEYRYLQASIRRFPPLAEFADILRQHGFETVEVRSLSFGACGLFVATHGQRT